jgi:hypothetical protein
MFERMLSMFQTIQDRQDTLQRQLLADRAENRAFMTLMLQHTGVLLHPVRSAPPSLQAAIVPAIQAKTPSSFSWSFYLSAPVGHPGFLITGHQLRQHSAASATSSYCYHYCCGDVYDLFSSDSSCSASAVRVSTSSSFYGRSWIRD